MIIEIDHLFHSNCYCSCSFCTVNRKYTITCCKIESIMIDTIAIATATAAATETATATATTTDDSMVYRLVL
jgi:hypothetical protein